MNNDSKKNRQWVQGELFPEYANPQGGSKSVTNKQQYRKMKVALCRTCIAYTADGEMPGYGTCAVSGCLVCECAQGCIDWRYYKIWRP